MGARRAQAENARRKRAATKLVGKKTAWHFERAVRTGGSAADAPRGGQYVLTMAQRRRQGAVDLRTI